MRTLYLFLNKKEYEVFIKFKNNQKIKILDYFFLLLKSIFNILESLIRNISGPPGFFLRRVYYKLIFKKMGKDVLIDTGVVMTNPQNISCGNKVWIDAFTVISIPSSNVIIGSEVHIHSHVYIGGSEDIIIEDQCGISSGTKIFTGSIKIPKKTEKILNPMMETNSNLSVSAKVHLKKNSAILANCTISPGIEIGVGSLVLSNSFVTRSTQDYSINLGVPSKVIGYRIE